MLKNYLKQLKISVLMLFVCTIFCGLVYPAIITLIAQTLFPWQANGSIITHDGKQVGSKLIGQNFTSDKYFWGRPSATEPFPYNAEASSGSNLAPTNPVLKDKIKLELSRYVDNGPNNIAHRIPVDLVTSSASGLDPDISIRAALVQIHRIASARNLNARKIYTLVQRFIQHKTLSIFGVERINVLQLNLALDALDLKEKHNG